MYDWQDFIPKSTPYKKPFILNGHMFTEKPSPDGTLPDDLVNDGQAEDLLTESSEDEETPEEEPEEEEQIDSEEEDPDDKIKRLAEEEYRR